MEIPLSQVLDYKHKADKIARFVIDRTFAKFYPTPHLPPLKFLDRHQREGISWILSRSRSYLAHAPGAGKTCQAIVASHLVLQRGQVLFVVPPDLTLNWQRETVRFSSLMGITSTVSIVPLTIDRDLVDWEADFIICPDSLLTRHWVYTNLLRREFKLIAVDEASRFKEPTSNRARAFFGGKINETEYPGLFQDCRHTVFLDGSPLTNRPMELWGPCYALNPSAIGFMESTEFGRFYCGARINHRGVWEFKGSSHEAELKERIQKNFMHVVRENELDHPERLRSILLINKDVRTPEMKEWERKNLKGLLKKGINEKTSQNEIAHQRRQIGLHKCQWVANYIRDRLKHKSESILLFAWHREVCENLAIYLQEFKPAVIYGGVSNVEREKIFRDFQAGRRKIIIGNIQAMGRGHNLQKADRVVFAEYSWSSELNKQCEKRSSRRGSKKSFVRCEYLVIPNSMDEVVLISVFRKEKMVKAIIG